MVPHARIIVRNFGPFEHADLVLKPLTLLIGKNSVGKSMLSYLIWTLASIMPNFEKLAEILTERNVDEVARKILDCIEKGVSPEDKVKELIRMHIETLPEAIASSLKEALQKVFVTRLNGLIREGASRASIELEGPQASLKLVIENEDIRVTSHKPYLEFTDELKVRISRPNRLKIIFPDGYEKEYYVTSISDLASVTLEMLANYIVRVLHPFFIFTYAVLLPDSRAGISRTLLKPYIHPTLTKRISYVDEQFIDLYFKFAEYVHEGLVDLKMLEPLLKELGCDLEVVFEKGVYTIYAKTWTGKRLPLPQAPSGIRESLIVALALASKDEPKLIVIEEPEAHLHPRAQCVLSRLIVRAVNEKGKIVLITTHSDYIIYSINNLIALSQHRDKARELGYMDSEVLEPSKVAAYLVRAEGNKAILEPLRVDSSGIPEDEFAKISEELLEERSRIMV